MVCLFFVAMIALQKQMVDMFEWKHPNYYRELRKLREEAEKELEKKEQEEEDKKED